MTANINSLKYELISQITELENEQEIIELQQHIKLLRAKRQFGDVIKPIRETISVQQLKAEQGDKRFNRAEFDALVAELDIQEPIEELLAMLD